MTIAGTSEAETLVSSKAERLLAISEDKKAFRSDPLLSYNLLTPVPPVTARDEPWPFFHF